jgi:hypothetical protein
VHIDWTNIITVLGWVEFINWVNDLLTSWFLNSQPLQAPADLFAAATSNYISGELTAQPGHLHWTPRSSMITSTCLYIIFKPKEEKTMESGMKLNKYKLSHKVFRDWELGMRYSRTN